MNRKIATSTISKKPSFLMPQLNGNIANGLLLDSLAKPMQRMCHVANLCLSSSILTMVILQLKHNLLGFAISWVSKNPTAILGAQPHNCLNELLRTSIRDYKRISSKQYAALFDHTLSIAVN